MARSILLGLCATVMIPLPVAKAVATEEIKTFLPSTIKTNNNLASFCSLNFKLDRCIPFKSKNSRKSKIYSELWLKNIGQVLLSGSMFPGCKTTLKLSSNLPSEQFSVLGNQSGNLDCFFSWQEPGKSNTKSQLNRDILLSETLSKSNHFLESKKNRVAIETPQKFPKLSRSSLMVSYPKTNSTFKPKETKLANPAPETKRIASPFGWRKRPYSYQLQFHQGIDYGAPLGSPVVAVGNGIVTRVVSGCYDFGNLFCGGQLGNWIEVDHGNGKLGIYGHLKNNSITVKEGMKVRKNQKIAQVGSSGWSTGAHLDFRFKVNGKYEDPALYVTVPSF